MSGLPPSFVDGNILTAGELNLIRAARNGDLLPIDEGTNNPTDLAGNLGSPTERWNSIHLPSGDNVFIGAKTLTELLEENVFDSNCSELVIDHFGDIGAPTNFIITKLAKHKLLRIAFGGQEYDTSTSADRGRISVTVGSVPSRVLYSGLISDSRLTPEPAFANYGNGISWFDISGEPDGNLTVAVSEGVSGVQSRFWFQAYVNAF